MLKKSIVKTASAIALGVALLSCSVTQAADLKLAVIDVNHIMATSLEVKAIETSLKKEFSKKEETLISMSKSFKNLVEKLQRNSAIMSPAERTKLEKEAGNKQKELQRMQAKFQEEGATRQRAEMQKFLDKLKKSVSNVATQEKIDMVFVRDAVPYSLNKFEITQKVIQNLNKS